MRRRRNAHALGLLVVLLAGTTAWGEQAATLASKPAQEVTGAALGHVLSRRFGCATCHSSDGSPKIGPTWKGLYGTEERLTGGVRVKVNEAYLYESIADPNAKIVKGFAPGFMPQDFGHKLSGSDIRAIIDYIKTLR